VDNGEAISVKSTLSSCKQNRDSSTQESVLSLKGVGPSVAGKLARLGIYTIQDLLFHLPLRYQDRTQIVPIGSLRPGDQVVVEGEVEICEIGYGKRRSLLCRISDGTGFITLRFFHFTAAQKNNLARGVCLRCFGEVRNGTASREMIHPEYVRIEEGMQGEAEASLTPIYPTTEGVHQLKLRDLTEQVLVRMEQACPDITEWLPEPILSQLQLPSLSEAVRFLHRPPPGVSLHALEEGRHPAQQRLVFEELLAHQLSLVRLRSRVQHFCAPALDVDGALWGSLRVQLPFELTQAQLRVINEIGRDLVAPHPMMRLVQGDVGSGKTVVAAAAALAAIETGFQVALMAPTEILAEQHYRNFLQWLEPLELPVAWLSGRQKGKVRERVLQQIEQGEARLVVGTHALFQEGVEFQHLALVIVDEQHRFGVHQRLALREKGQANGMHPHQLIMTATPIPRTLAMTVYADLDVSVIDELPPGRIPVKTVVIPESRRAEVVQRVHKACALGQQAYWVCTLIEESEVLQCQAAEDAQLQLQQALPELRIALVHGRMKAAEKEGVMRRFKEGEIDLLVATTVIEVGVDVGNASLMIIENAERLGLSQLHQLRGRVGRGNAESSCVLMYHGALSALARARLGVMRETTDGFEIARRDLEIRGPGEVLGTRQTGMMQMRIADLLRDQALLPSVQQTAQLLLAQYPRHVGPLIQRWIGEGVQYSAV
jgi:ATP-dependent DNA helicase RecG